MGYVLPPGERHEPGGFEVMNNLTYHLEDNVAHTFRAHRGPDAWLDRPEIFWPRIPLLPPWNPAGNVLFPEWTLDIQTWLNQTATRMNPGDQASAIRLALRGAAREFVSTFPFADDNLGATINGVRVDPVTYLLYSLSIEYSSGARVYANGTGQPTYPEQEHTAAVATTYMLESREETLPPEHNEETISDVRQYPTPREYESSSHLEPPIHNVDGTLNTEYIFQDQLRPLEHRKAEDGLYFHELQFRTYYGADTYALHWAAALNRERFESPEDYGDNVPPQAITENSWVLCPGVPGDPNPVNPPAAAKWIQSVIEDSSSLKPSWTGRKPPLASDLDT